MIKLALEVTSKHLHLLDKEYKTTREALQDLKENGKEWEIDLIDARVHIIQLKKCVDVLEPSSYKLQVKEFKAEYTEPFKEEKKGKDK